MEENSINNRIAGYRKLAGLTQAEAADLLGLKRNTYARMEKYGNPSPDMLKKMSELFRVSVATLIYGEESNAPFVPHTNNSHLVFEQSTYQDVLPLSLLEANAVRIFRNFDKTDQQKIIDFFNQVYRDTKKK